MLEEPVVLDVISSIEEVEENPLLEVANVPLTEDRVTDDSEYSVVLDR